MKVGSTTKKLIDITGQRYGRLTVIKREGSHNGYPLWECKCDCGNTYYAVGGNLRGGRTQSCGCIVKDKMAKTLKRKSTEKDKTRTRLYATYNTMMQRCYNDKTKSYNAYGGRGIKICNGWRNSFQSFYKWAIRNGYKKGLELDRKDNNGDYKPRNCHYITKQENAWNRRDSHYVTVNGITKPITVWARDIGVAHGTIHGAIRRGISAESYIEKKLAHGY